jgi:hypothetical protein
MTAEEKIMVEELDKNLCRCGSARNLTSSARYTDPLQYEWRCRCGAVGTVGYDSLSLSERKIVVSALRNLGATG